MAAGNVLKRLLARGSLRRNSLTILLGFLLAVVAPAVYAQVRIGVVDIRRAIAESNEGRAGLDAMKVRYDSRQTDIDRRTKAIEALKAKIEKSKTPIPPAKLQKMAQDYQEQVLQLQQLGQQYTQELQEMEAELTKTVMSKMQPLMREIGQADNYQVIVDAQVVHFAPSHLDLTDRVIQLYNQRNPVTSAPDAGRPVGSTTSGTTPTTTADAGSAEPESSGDGGRSGLSPLFFRDGGR